MKRSLGLETITHAEFESLAQARELISHRAGLIGEALAPLVNAITPQAIVIGGPAPSLHSLIVPQVVKALQTRTIAPALGDLHVRLGEPRWNAVGDDIGRLATVSGVIAFMLEREGPDYLVSHVHPPPTLLKTGQD